MHGVSRQQRRAGLGDEAADVGEEAGGGLFGGGGGGQDGGGEARCGVGGLTPGGHGGEDRGWVVDCGCVAGRVEEVEGWGCDEAVDFEDGVSGGVEACHLAVDPNEEVLGGGHGSGGLAATDRWWGGGRGGESWRWRCFGSFGSEETEMVLLTLPEYHWH